MARGRREQAALPLEQPVRVKLTDEDRAAKGHQMAVKRLALRAVKRQLKAATKNAKAEIARIETEMDAIADDLVADEEIRKQGDLRYDGKTEATPILATVERVASGEKAPAPNLPHTFVPDQKGEGKCFACAKGKDDAVHQQPSEPHAFAPTGDHGTAKHMCRVCGAGKSDPVHGAAAEVKVPPPASPTKPASGGGRQARPSSRA